MAASACPFAPGSLAVGGSDDVVLLAVGPSASSGHDIGSDMIHTSAAAGSDMVPSSALAGYDMFHASSDMPPLRRVLTWATGGMATPQSLLL